MMLDGALSLSPRLGVTVTTVWSQANGETRVCVADSDNEEGESKSE